MSFARLLISSTFLLLVRNNEKTSMTAERIAVLEELGFNFDVGAAQRRPRTTVNKTWDERFLELARL